jgi:Family of unknown function (DUF6057)
MEKKKVFKYSEYLFSVIFFAGIFVFYAFFYNSHLHFEEQFQLFLLTGDFFTSKIVYPGGFSGWTGGFLTQFYYLSLAGPMIIAGLLLALQQIMKRILYKVKSGPVPFPFSFIPSMLAGMMLCNEFYPLSAIIGFLISMLAGLAYVGIKGYRTRFIAGLIFIPLTYWLAGGSFISLVLLMLVYELLLYLRSWKKADTGKAPLNSYIIRRWYFIAYIVIAAGIPLLVRQFLILQPIMMTFISEFYYNIPTSFPTEVLVLFILPPVLILIVHFISLKEKYNITFLALQIALFSVLCWLGFRSYANFEAEKVMTYDYLTRNERWSDVLKYADSNPPRNYLSLAMLNLSLAKTKQLGNRMFNYDQHGINGLFLSFNREYVTAIMGNEILYQLGLTNASQEYAFESMETIPNMGKSARVIRRLAETNLINGQYKVSEKYLKLLEKTIFYRKWAKSAMAAIGNEDLIYNDPNWGEKRRFLVKNDYFFHIKNIEAVLNRMVKEHPDNKMAFEYLMAFYMINKDLRNFINLIPVMEKMGYNKVPTSYQEAIMYIIGQNNEDPMINSPVYVSQDTRLRMKAYADIYTKYPDARERLEKRFSGTYWFYLHFKEVELSSAEEKKNNTGST